MSRFLVLFVLIASLAASGCVVDGEEIAADALEELDKYIDTKFSDQYLDVVPEADANEDGRLTEDEALCSDPVFTTVEPFPAGGILSPEYITPPNSYLECFDYSSSGILRLNADGTVSGYYTSGYQDELDFWNLCKVGPQPPEISGNWIYYPDYEASCIRDNVIPGIIQCGSAYSDESYYFHGGEVIGSEYVEPSECYLREE